MAAASRFGLRLAVWRALVQVGTPGRLVDHLSNTKGFSLRALKYLVRLHHAP